MLYAFFWVIPRRLNSDAGELPRKKAYNIQNKAKSLKSRIRDLCFFNILFMFVFLSYVSCFLILCILCFYIICVLFCILFLLLYTAVSFLFLYKSTDRCHRPETQLQ